MFFNNELEMIKNPHYLTLDMPWALQQSGRNKTFLFDAHPAHLSVGSTLRDRLRGGSTHLFLNRRVQYSSLVNAWFPVIPLHEREMP